MDRSWLSAQPRTMLITGATGFIGSRLATLALGRGYSVRTLTRSDWDGPPAVPVDQRHIGDLPEQIPEQAFAGVDVVVHCAAQFEGRERGAWAVNVEGTARLAELAQGARVQTFIFLSSQAARPDALSVYGKTKYAAEQRLLEQSGLGVVVARPGLVTGPGGRGLFHRLCRMVDSLPVIPLLGGRRSIVQPIYVDDLCEAIFRIDERAPELDKSLLKLGDPEGTTLVEFLQKIAAARGGHRKLVLRIPLLPVELGVGIAERLGLSLPINTNNLKGMKIVEKMETGADLERLGLPLRSLDEMVQDQAAAGERRPPLRERAVRVLLVGAGRIGLVHAVTLSRLAGVVLAGVVDPNSRATALLRGMGLGAPMFRSLNEALTRVKPDAVVLATPVVTHLALTRAALVGGVAAVLVEKPLALRREQLADYEWLAEQFPGRTIQVGYVMPRNPQVASYLEDLRGGRLGKVRGFVGTTLLSLIQETGTDRWEVKKDVSGGGALINSGGHVLSMIRAAFGDPETCEAETFRPYSTEVEDSVAVTLTYPGFSGRHYCSWSIGGYPRQENMLTIWTDQGRLVLTGSVGVFVRNDGAVDVSHQLDFDVGFNMAPDYAGAGFTAELSDLKQAARTGQPAPMSLAEAVKLERLMFEAYRVAREVKIFSQGRLAVEPLPAGPLRLSDDDRGASERPAIRRVLDLRDLSTAKAHAYLGGLAGSAKWDEYLLAASQLRGLPTSWRDGQRLRVTVPDFLTQSRLLSTGRHAQVIKQMGIGGIVAGALTASPLLASERGATFWVAAMGLLAAALWAVPPEFTGTLLLHGYLTDFALSLRRLDMLQKMLTRCRRTRPRARTGFHTNMAAEALNALRLLDTPVDEVSVLTSPRALHVGRTLGAMRRAAAPSSLRLTAEVGLAPSIVHRVAFEAPHRWASEADAVLIGSAAEARLAETRRREVAQEWAKVFPGLSLPDGVW